MLRSVEVDVGCSIEQVDAPWAKSENVPHWMPLSKELDTYSDNWRKRDDEREKRQ